MTKSYIKKEVTSLWVFGEEKAMEKKLEKQK